MFECPTCQGIGCSDCEDGAWRLTQCPKKFIGWEMTDAVNAMGIAISGLWPVGGGLLDQSAWFVDAVAVLSSEQNKIDRERMRRGHSD